MRVQQEHPWDSSCSVWSWGWQWGPELCGNDFSPLAEMGVGSLRACCAWEGKVTLEGCEFTGLLPDPAAPHAQLGYGQLQLLRGDRQVVFGFCWFVCLGFRKPAHLGQANLPV